MRTEYLKYLKDFRFLIAMAVVFCASWAIWDGLVAFVAFNLFAVGCVIVSVVLDRGLHSGSKERRMVARAADEEYKTDAKLWELLHEEDPAWLVAMGIEKPQYVLRAEEAEKAKTMRYKPGEVIPIHAPSTYLAMYDGNSTYLVIRDEKNQSKGGEEDEWRF